MVAQDSDNRTQIEEADRLLKDFECWLIDNGSEFPKLRFFRTPASGDTGGSERGVFCKTIINPKEIILRVPLQCIITSDIARSETPLARKLWASTPNFEAADDLIALVVHVLLTRSNQDYYFQPYYRILPSDVSNFPIFWSEAQIGYVQGSSIIETIRERRQKMEHDYYEVCRICPDFRVHSDLYDFLRIRTLVGSRNFGISVNGKKVSSLVPYADMLNHTRPPETHWTFKDAMNSFIITSTGGYSPGVEVFDSYGPKSNDEYLLYYGFVIKNNCDASGFCRDSLFISVPLGDQETSKLRERKIALLKYLKKSPDSDMELDYQYELRRGSGPGVPSMLLYFRIKVATEQELDYFLTRNKISTDAVTAGEKKSKPKLSGCEVISPLNEARALEALAEHCANLLKEYPNTYDENEATLKDLENENSPDYVRRTAVTFILSEQAIYKFWVDACNAVVPILRSTNPSFELVDELGAIGKNKGVSYDLKSFVWFLMDEMNELIYNK
mmetsp:Transcript_12824/g.14796  ORF Transcript_12824/g.14796 Transcript_12824/m.14796 type:complete len:501 (-) Transcript_12824:1505-3007(-)